MTASTLFSAYYAAALVVLVAELAGGRGVRRLRAARTPATPYAAAIVVSYACELFVIRYAAVAQTDWAVWRSALPLPVVTRTAVHAELVALAVYALTVVQTWALWQIYRRGLPRRVLVAVCALLAAASLCEPALISPDAYSYVADALLGGASYAPPATAFPGAYRVINDALGVPLPAAPYGPLWIAIARAIALPLPNLLLQLLSFRVLGLAAFAAFLTALARLHVPMRLLAIAAINPGLMLQYVANAHNEMLCMACVAWAAVAVRKAPHAAALLLVAAAMVKLPFALLGAPLFVRLPAPLVRVLWAGLTVAVSVALSWLFGGAPYLETLVRHLPNGSAADILGLLVTAASVALLTAALMSRRRLRTAVWCFPLAASYPTPWYAGWGLGYALGSRRTLASLLIWFPVCSALVDTMFMQLWTVEIAVPLLAIVCAMVLVAQRRRTA